MLCDALYAVAAAALHLEDLEEASAPAVAIVVARDQMLALTIAAIHVGDLQMLLYLVGDEPACRDLALAAIEAKALRASGGFLRREAS